MVEVEVCKSTAYHGRDQPETEDYDLTVKGNNPIEVVNTYIELRDRLNKALEEVK